MKLRFAPSNVARVRSNPIGGGGGEFPASADRPPGRSLSRFDSISSRFEKPGRLDEVIAGKEARIVGTRDCSGLEASPGIAAQGLRMRESGC